jgi:hypothetical protein
MSRPTEADLDALIGALISAGVELIVIGGAAAVLHGAPITTLDLDIVYRQTPANLDRLLAVLRSLDAVVRDAAGRHVRPTRAHLEAGGQLLLSTALGPVDAMGRLHDGRGFDDLLSHTEAVADEELRFRVLDLPTLIEVKTAAARAKDRLVLPILLALLEQRGREV